jgi:hydroxyacylglutathione hydrolase
MEVQVFSGGPFFVNCYVLYDQRGGQAVVIDPGLDVKKLKSFIGGRKLKVHTILLTHGHVDHVMHLAALYQLTRARILIHDLDKKQYDNAQHMALAFGIPRIEGLPKPSAGLSDGQKIHIGDEHLVVRHTPGHSPGSVSFVLDGAFVITGDTLFNDGIGRTDLPGGSYPQIMSSIKEKILVLPDEMIVYPGHGPQSTVGFEKRSNPFLNGEP